MAITKHRAGGSRGANGYGEYQVRYASDKQKNFIKKLLEQKQHNFTGELDTLNVQGAGELITNLLSLPDKVGFVDVASEKQVSFAQSLALSKEGGQELVNQVLQLGKFQSLEQIPKKQMSNLINTLRSKEDKKATITDVGAYLYEGVVYSVRKNYHSGRLFLYTFDEVAKKYLINIPATKKFLPKLLPTHRLTLEEAEKYSANTGVCCHCGRTLTALKSVAGGIGSVCAKHYIKSRGVSSLL